MNLICRILFLCFALLPQFVGAQGRFTTRLTDKGTLHFLEPKKLNDLSGVSRFEFDMTYVTSTDSAYVNFSVKAPVAVKPSDIRLCYGTGLILSCDDSRLLFIDRHGASYEIRMMCRFPISELRKALEEASPPVFRFKMGNSEASASYRPSAWKKDRIRINEMFNLIDIVKR